jgi:putative peptide zinc metalloprotease protein
MGDAVGVDVWQDLAGSLDAARTWPELGDWVEVRRFDLPRGQSYVMAANRRELVYFRLTPADADVMDLLDGTRTVGEIVVELMQGSGELDMPGVVGLIRLLYEGNFLVEPYIDVPAALERALHPPRQARDGLTTFMRTLTVEWTGAERMALWMYRHGLKHVFRPSVQIVAAVFAIVGFVLFITATHEHHYKLTTQSVGVGLVVLLLLNLLLIYVHEMGHATLLVHYGRRLKSAGFRIYYGAPCFFMDSSDALMLSRGQRIAQAFAGPYFEAVAAGVSSVVLFAFPTSAMSPLLYRFCLLNYIVLLENLIPLLELDGYWILSDALQIPDLRPRSLAFIRRDMWAKLRRRERWSSGDVGLALYATAGVVFTIACFWLAYYFWTKNFGGVVSSLWHAGPGGVVALIILALFIMGPLLRAFGQTIAALGRQLLRWFAAVRFRTQLSWRIRAAELLEAQPAFADLPIGVLNDIAGRVGRRHLGPGQIVFHQGDRADAYYVVGGGTLEVIEDDKASDTTRVVRRIGAGESFGEFGLAKGAPRSATVQTTSHVDLYILDRGDFDRLLAERITLPAFPTTLHQLDELHALPPFAHLGPAELNQLAQHGAWVRLSPGSALMHQGEIGRSLFTLASGRVAVDIDGRTIRERGPGDHVGELALLLDQPRTATVRALTPVRAFELDRSGFDSLLRDAFARGLLRPHIGADRTWDH